MDKQNLKRVKNILSGDYTGKISTSIGYQKTNEKHIEGDIWEEEGKTWTIKNGIKRTLTKLDSVRKTVRMPLTCPNCNNIMRSKQDKKSWHIKGICFNCLIQEDTNKIIKGTFKEYEKETIIKNMKSYISHVGDYFDDYIDNLDEQHFITEQGDVEKWTKGITKEKLKELFSKQIEEFKNKIDKKESKNDNSK